MNPAAIKTSGKKELYPAWRAILFLLLLLTILFALARLFDHAAQTDLRRKARWILSKEGQTYDFAVLGSSRSYMGMDIFALEKEVGQKGINLSLEGTSYPEEFLALKLFLSRNKVQELILDINFLELDRSGFNFPFHAYDYLPDIGNEDVFEVLRDNFGFKSYLWRYIPFYKNAEFNTKLGVLQFYIWARLQLKSRFNRPDFDEKGSWLVPGAKPLDESILALPEKNWLWGANDQKYFSKIVSLAREKGIKLTLIDMPEYHLWLAKQKNRGEMISFYEAAARSNNFSFLQFNQDAICFDKSLFLDRAHLNRNGARIFSTKLGQALNQQKMPNASAEPLFLK